MTHIEQSISGFSSRMKATFNFASAPLNLLTSLFSVSGEEEHGYIIRGISIFFGLIFSPVLLLAAPATLIMGIIAGIAQTAFFPFQLFFSAFKDVMAPSNLDDEKKSIPSGYELSYDSSCEYDAEKGAGKHFDPLFSDKRTSIEAPALELTSKDNSFTPKYN